MVVGEIKRSSGFGKPPWLFKGRQVSDFWVFFFLFLFLIKIPIIWLISFPIFSNNKTFHLLVIRFLLSALYQLHLVKAETARACIPKEFRLVEAFGYLY